MPKCREQFASSITESALAEKAQAVFERHERLTLSRHAFARFVALTECSCQSPPSGNWAMAEATGGQGPGIRPDPASF
ncbi:MAG: DUF1778 domain-containing protein [Armatimonadetes bacterium]|nr:DUF1778 domain-containing protein [Armatimonadota bacterium]